jgi:transposase
MSKRKSKLQPKQPRRKHSDEFKQEAVKLVLDQGMSVSQVAINLGINVSMLHTWVRRLESENSNVSQAGEEQMEIARLREENRRLRMERDILKKATAFFANEKN